MKPGMADEKPSPQQFKDILAEIFCIASELRLGRTKTGLVLSPWHLMSISIADELTNRAGGGRQNLKQAIRESLNSLNLALEDISEAAPHAEFVQNVVRAFEYGATLVELLTGEKRLILWNGSLRVFDPKLVRPEVKAAVDGLNAWLKNRLPAPKENANVT
jgi:hypothetical protein